MRRYLLLVTILATVSPPAQSAWVNFGGDAGRTGSATGNASEPADWEPIGDRMLVFGPRNFTSLGIGGEGGSSVVSSRGVVFSVVRTGRVNALDSVSQSLTWRPALPGAVFPDATSPALGQRTGSVFVTGPNGSWALDGNSGALLRTCRTAAGVGSPVVLDDGASEFVLLSTPGGTVTALRGLDGRVECGPRHASRGIPLVP